MNANKNVSIHPGTPFGLYTRRKIRPAIMEEIAAIRSTMLNMVSMSILIVFRIVTHQLCLPNDLLQIFLSDLRKDGENKDWPKQIVFDNTYVLNRIYEAIEVVVIMVHHLLTLCVITSFIP